MGDAPKPGARKSVSGSANSGGSGPTVADSGTGPRVVFFGTSLTAGYGIQPNQTFPAIIEKLALADGLPIRGVNSGLSGETSAGAARRIEWDLQTAFDILVMETGGNDALRGLDPAQLKANLEVIVAKVKVAQPKARIVLLEMQAPPNLGSAYTSSFRQAFRTVASEEKVTLLPFFLDGVAGRPALNQADGIHPSAKGAMLIAENVWRGLKPLVAEVRKGQESAATN